MAPIQEHHCTVCGRQHKECCGACRAGLRQMLIALRIQLKKERHEKWRHAIDRIGEFLGDVDRDGAAEGT